MWRKRKRKKDYDELVIKMSDEAYEMRKREGIIKENIKYTPKMFMRWTSTNADVICYYLMSMIYPYLLSWINPNHIEITLVRFYIMLKRLNVSQCMAMAGIIIR
jgi:hypothetical protein